MFLMPGILFSIIQTDKIDESFECDERIPQSMSRLLFLSGLVEILAVAVAQVVSWPVIIILILQSIRRKIKIGG